jgi:hypothetical protein
MNHTPRSKFAYHFTDTVRLPWIVESGELRPVLNTSDGFPRDFLWATTNKLGDRTSSAMSPDGRRFWRDGRSLLVRFTLDSADFKGFPEMIENYPEWTSAHVAQLVSAAAAMGERHADQWLCRSEPLPLARVIRTEVKSYVEGRWTEIDLSSFPSDFSIGPNTRYVALGKNIYYSTRVVGQSGAAAYDVVRVPIEDAA